jgi:hypothetical protein
MRRCSGIVALLILLTLTLGLTAATAAFRKSTAGSAMSISSNTLAPPASTTLTRNWCFAGIAANVTISWTASPSAYATGYDVLRGTATGGPYTLQTSVGSGTLSYTQTISTGSSLYYVVRASFLSWRSANSTEVTFRANCA